MFFKLILIFGVLTKTIISSEIDTTNITIYTQEDLSDKLYYIQWEIKKRNYSAALDGLLELIDQKPNNIIINTNIALCYYKIKDYEKALKHSDLALKSAEIYSLAIQIKTQSLFKLANKSFSESKFSEAEAYFMQALELRPNDKRILSTIASLFFEQKQYDNAANYASLALGIDRRCGNAQYIYGKSLFKIGEKELYFNKNFDKAFELLQKALEFTPRNKFICVDLAFIYAEKKNFIEAIEWADFALKYDSKFYQAKVIKAGCLIGSAEISFKEEDYSQFKNNLKKSFQIVPGNTNIYIKYATMFSKVKRYSESLEYAELALELEPENELAKEIKIDSINCLKNDWTYYSIFC